MGLLQARWSSHRFTQIRSASTHTNPWTGLKGFGKSPELLMITRPCWADCNRLVLITVKTGGTNNLSILARWFTTWALTVIGTVAIRTSYTQWRPSCPTVPSSQLTTPLLWLVQRALMSLSVIWRPGGVLAPQDEATSQRIMACRVLIKP